MDKKYLIVECWELSDQNECDADRTPITLCSNYKVWEKENEPEYLFEVYELKNNTFKLIKNYTEK